MNALKMSLALAFVAGSMLALSTGARADVACNGAGDCWTTQHYTYPQGVHVQVYPDTWRQQHENDTHYRWLEHHQDRGYYTEKREWHPF